MPIYIGNELIKKIYLGTTEIQKLYLGNTLIIDGGESDESDQPTPVIPSYIIDEHTLGVWHFENNDTNAVNGSEVGISKTGFTKLYSNSNSKFNDYCAQLRLQNTTQGAIDLFQNYGEVFSSDFTLDFWVRTLGSTGTGNTCFSIAVNRTTPIVSFFIYKNKIECQNSLYSKSFAVNTWHHLAFERYSNIIYCYIDGEMIYSTTEGQTLDATMAYTKLISGTASANCPYIDEMRLSNIARYEGQNFTPFNVPYHYEESDSDTPISSYQNLFKMGFDGNLNYTSDFPDNVEVMLNYGHIDSSNYKFGTGSLKSTTSSDDQYHAIEFIADNSNDYDELTVDFWIYHPNDYFDENFGYYDEPDTVFKAMWDDEEGETGNIEESYIFIDFGSDSSNTADLIFNAENYYAGSGSTNASSEITFSDEIVKGSWQHIGLYKNSTGLYALANGKIRLISNDALLLQKFNDFKWADDDTSIGVSRAGLDEIRVTYGNPLADFNLTNMTYSVPTN